MNAVFDERPDARPAAGPAQLREIAHMRFVIRVLEDRARSEFSSFLWQIRLKVARHMYKVLVRRAGMIDANELPELSPAEEDELLRTHWMLQCDTGRPCAAAREGEWMRDVESKVARFTNRLRTRRTRDL